MTRESEVLSKLKPNWKLWLESEGEYIFGPGAYFILDHIHKHGTIKSLEEPVKIMSYRYAWGVIRKIEKKLGFKIVETFKGGSSGGGGARITEFGLQLMDLFASVQESFNEATQNHR
ncbi:MAG: winged helix-turn-helix domain-containing protein [Candidatus Hodarchaeota archaeon]